MSVTLRGSKQDASVGSEMWVCSDALKVSAIRP